METRTGCLEATSARICDEATGDGPPAAVVRAGVANLREHVSRR